MTLDVVLRYRTRRPWAPGPASLRRWAKLAAGDCRGVLGIRVVGSRESRALNQRWRGRAKPTNVLSFPAFPVQPGKVPGPMLGDIIIAKETVEREAVELEKSFDDHLTHLLVHGFLHLFGYDHNNDAEAERMEGLETRILEILGLSDPYEGQDLKMEP